MMKRTFFFVVTVLAFTVSLKGSNDTIVTPNKLWSHVSCVSHPNYIPCRYSYYTKFEEDTTISDTHYLKVFTSKDSIMGEWDLIGFIREEDNKIYRILAGESNEGLLYDFNISIGDTVNVKTTFGPCEVEMEVIAVDSISTQTKKRRRIKLYNYHTDLEEYWIEGMGSSFGIMNSGFCATSAQHLLCFWNNGELEYSNPDFEQCFIANPYTLKENESYGIVKLFPNPASRIIHLEVDMSFSNQKLIFNIFTIDGQLVFSAQTLGNESFNVSDLPKGIYRYSLTTSSKIIFGSGNLVLQ